MCPDRLRDRLPCISHGIFRNGYRSKHQRASCLRHLIVVSPRRIVRICAGKHFSIKLILSLIQIVRTLADLLVQFEGIILRKSDIDIDFCSGFGTRVMPLSHDLLQLFSLRVRACSDSEESHRAE